MAPETACPTCKTPIPASANFCPGCGKEKTGISPAAAATFTADVPVSSRLATALGPKYEVRRMLGQGGFAEVYEVWDQDLQRRLAVKVLKPDIAWSSGMLDRFKHEARAIARLNHPNILPIHFVGDGEGLVYYAMPFVEGQSLAELLRTRGAIDPERALALTRPLVEALAHAHESGLVHRDIKPDNIMIEASSGRPLLVDFGIAKRLDGEASHFTQTGFVVGTPQYMSPEQALGQGNVDARSDLYAMGAVLFQMVTGAPPYEGETSQEIVGKHLSEPVPIATAKNARIPMWLSNVITRCMAKRPGDRYQSAKALLEALNLGRQSGPQGTISAERVAKQIQGDEATVKMPSQERRASSAPTVVSSPAPARKAQWGTVALLMVLLAGAGALVLNRTRPVLQVENHLLEPVSLVVDGVTRQIPSGEAIEVPLRRGRPLVAQWYLVRPVSSAGNPMGVALQGTFTEPRARGRLARVVDAGAGASPVFAPLVSNATTSALGIVVNAGLAGAVDCFCPIPPGATHAHIGYWPLFANSTVQAYTAAGTRAAFKDLGSEVDRGTGTVGLRFEDKDFH
jgi:serine/threonine protein kinase